MALIFHQNMRDYGGGSIIRNNAYDIALTAINAATGANYWVAGFTEITNAGTSRAALTARATVLDPGLTRLIVLNVGTMAVSGRSEYLGIAWDPAYITVQHAGQVMKHAVTRTWNAYDNTAPFGGFANPQVIGRPAVGALTADSRGLAYIAALRGATPYIFAFMHNMYMEGDKTGAYNNLNNMAALIRAAVGGAYAAAEVIIGGDFNLAPRNPKRPRGAALNLTARAARAGGDWANTTAANPYDFWVVSNAGLANAACAVRANTRVAHCSDHAAITLNR